MWWGGRGARHYLAHSHEKAGAKRCPEATKKGNSFSKLLAWTGLQLGSGGRTGSREIYTATAGWVVQCRLRLAASYLTPTHGDTRQRHAGRHAATVPRWVDLNLGLCRVPVAGGGLISSRRTTQTSSVNLSDRIISVAWW